MKQKNSEVKEFSAIILAAGESSRMGIPKLSLSYDESTNFLEHIVNEYELFGCNEIVIVVNGQGKKYLKENDIKFPENIKIVLNAHTELHRFYSLKIGVRALSNTKPVFIHNVDNPFVNQRVLTELVNKYKYADYINPQYNEKGGHPFLLSKTVINDIKSSHEDKLHLKEFLNQYSRLRIKVDDEKVLVNINTIDEYRTYFRL